MSPARARRQRRSERGGAANAARDADSRRRKRRGSESDGGATGERKRRWEQTAGDGGDGARKRRGPDRQGEAVRAQKQRARQMRWDGLPGEGREADQEEAGFHGQADAKGRGEGDEHVHGFLLVFGRGPGGAWYNVRAGAVAWVMPGNSQKHARTAPNDSEWIRSMPGDIFEHNATLKTNLYTF